MKSRLSKVPELLKKSLAEKWQAEAFSELIEKEIASLPQLKAGVPEDSFKLSATSFPSSVPVSSNKSAKTPYN